jgi:hypothetical protein
VLGKGERFLKGGTHTNKLGIRLVSSGIGIGVGMRFFGAAIEGGFDFGDCGAALKTECFKGTFFVITIVTTEVTCVRRRRTTTTDAGDATLREEQR